MRLRQLGLGLVVASTAFVGTARGALLVTEAMPNPGGTDANNEWMEIYNSGSLPVNLTGYAVGDGLSSTGTSGGEGLGVFPDGTIIAPGQVYIIAIRNAGFSSLVASTFPGLNADFEFANPLLDANGNPTTTVADDPNIPNLVQKTGWGNATASLAMANGGDDFGIVDPAGNIIDVLSYGGAASSATFKGWVDASNATMQRVPANVDSDTGSEWSYITGLPNSTPGQVTIPEPGSLALLGVGALGLLRRRRER